MYKDFPLKQVWVTTRKVNDFLALLISYLVSLEVEIIQMNWLLKMLVGNQKFTEVPSIDIALPWLFFYLLDIIKVFASDDWAHGV